MRVAQRVSIVNNTVLACWAAQAIAYCVGGWWCSFSNTVWQSSMQRDSNWSRRRGDWFVCTAAAFCARSHRRKKRRIFICLIEDYALISAFGKLYLRRAMLFGFSLIRFRKQALCSGWTAIRIILFDPSVTGLWTPSHSFSIACL